MSMTSLNDILVAAEALPAPERAELIAALWDKTSPDDWLPPKPEWLDEVNCRSEAYEAGELSTSEWSELRQRARRKAGLDE